MTISGGFALLLGIPALFVYICGFLWLINVADRQLEKALKAVTNKYELWGIMREAGGLYREKKEAKYK